MLLQIDKTFINGSTEFRLPHVSNISFAKVESEGLLLGINKEIAVSSGSACTSASIEPSYVLKAIGLPDEMAHSSIRFSIGRFTTEEEIVYTAERVAETINKLREMSPTIH
jgi:cysteine desulfurase